MLFPVGPRSSVRLCGGSVVRAVVSAAGGRGTFLHTSQTARFFLKDVFVYLSVGQFTCFVPRSQQDFCPSPGPCN